ARAVPPPRGEEGAARGELLDAGVARIRDVDIPAPVGRDAVGVVELAVARAQAPPSGEERADPGRGRERRGRHRGDCPRRSSARRRCRRSARGREGGGWEECFITRLLTQLPALLDQLPLAVTPLAASSNASLDCWLAHPPAHHCGGDWRGQGQEK